MTHPNGGPDLAIRLDPERARVAAGFDYFAIGVPGQDAIEALAARFTELDDAHAGVHRTPVGWVLPGVHDPDSHEVRFYTVPLELPADFDAVDAANQSQRSGTGSSGRGEHWRSIPFWLAAPRKGLGVAGRSTVSPRPVRT